MNELMKLRQGHQMHALHSESFEVIFKRTDLDRTRTTFNNSKYKLKRRQL